MKCSRCHAEKQAKTGKRGEKLPHNWKYHWSTNLVYCENCWLASFRMTAITIGIVGPRDKEQWPSLRESLNSAWGETMRLANYLHARRFSAEAWGVPRGEKLPKQPKPYLYHECRKIAPGLTAATCSVIDHAEERKYRANRYNMIHRGSTSLASSRFPRPLPLRKDSFKLIGEEDGRIFLQARITADSGRFDLKLDIGPNERRQKRMLEKCISGEYGVVEATIYRKPARKSDHRSAVESKRPATRIMAKIVAWIPIEARAAKLDQRFFSIKSDKDSFLYGILENRETPWVLNADHVRDWCYQHSRNLRRLAQDRKAEQRVPRQRRLRRNRELDQRCNKHHNRIKTFTDSAARMVVNFAVRNRVTKLKYDDTERGYFASQEASFPWAALESRLKQLCFETGITFESASDNVAAPDEGSLAELVSE